MSQNQSRSRVDRAPQGDLAQVIDLILDKGLVIDVFVKVSLVGIEILTIDARIVLASVDTYLRFAEATNRLDLHQKGGKDLTEVAGGITGNAARGGAGRKMKGELEQGKQQYVEKRDEHSAKQHDR